MKKSLFFACLLLNFSYLAFDGCADPRGLVAPVHFTRVPNVDNLEALVGRSLTGQRLVMLTWRYDTLNQNLRSWDVARSVNDTTTAAYVPLQIVRKPTIGFPAYSDSSPTVQNFGADSIELYYKVTPNGADSYTGRPSDILHVILRKNF